VGGVVGDDAAGLLPAMLQRVQAERHETRRIRHAEHAEDAAFLAELVVLNPGRGRRKGGGTGRLRRRASAGSMAAVGRPRFPVRVFSPWDIGQGGRPVTRPVTGMSRNVAVLHRPGPRGAALPQKRKERAQGPLSPFRTIRWDQKDMFRPSDQVLVEPSAGLGEKLALLSAVTSPQP
jgi:hypothetical protein